MQNFVIQKGTLRQRFICLRPPPLLGLCLGWSSNFVGSESGQSQSVKLLQSWLDNTNMIDCITTGDTVESINPNKTCRKVPLQVIFLDDDICFGTFFS
jgi:hypothetical protein